MAAPNLPQKSKNSTFFKGLEGFKGVLNNSTKLELKHHLGDLEAKVNVFRKAFNDVIDSLWKYQNEHNEIERQIQTSKDKTLIQRLKVNELNIASLTATINSTKDCLILIESKLEEIKNIDQSTSTIEEFKSKIEQQKTLDCF